MRLKEGQQLNARQLLEGFFVLFKKIFLNNFSRLVIWGFVLIVVLFFGFLAGLFFSGFFGSLDQPSPEVRELLVFFGIENAHELKVIASGLISHNVKIPYNFFRGFFTNVDRMRIDIEFTDYQKIMYKRQQAIDIGVLASSGDDYVPATIGYSGNEYDVKLRLKGDLSDHWGGDKLSFRVKVKGGDKIMGMEVFSLQAPETRQEVNEYIYNKMLRNFGVIGLRYKFVEVFVNGKNKGIFALEEHFSKELIENNGKREGLIFKFNDDVVFQRYAEELNNGGEANHNFLVSAFDVFDDYGDIANDSLMSGQLDVAFGLMEALRKNDVMPHEVLAYEEFAKYYAIGTLLDCPHASGWWNTRYYYNPIISKIEPIGFDGNCRIVGASEALYAHLPPCVRDSVYDVECFSEAERLSDIILSDRVIFEKYIETLEEFLEEGVLESSVDSFDEELKENVRILNKDNSFYFFDNGILYDARDEIGAVLNLSGGIHVYADSYDDGVFSMDVGNADFLPVEVIGVKYGDSFFEGTVKLLNPVKMEEVPVYHRVNVNIPRNIYSDSFLEEARVVYRIVGSKNTLETFIFPWRYVPENFLETDFIRSRANVSDFVFIDIDEVGKTMTVPSGKWIVGNDIVFPNDFDILIEAGVEIDLVNDSMLLFYSGVEFAGEEDNKIRVFSSDGTGQGISVLSAKSVSKISHVVFENFSAPSKSGWELSGGVNFYESDIEFVDVEFVGMNTEDSLNLVKSNFYMDGGIFRDCFSDCFDNDFGTGTISDSYFVNCGNDCLDFSGSEIVVNNVTLENIGDKGISAGENSVVSARDIVVSGNFTFIAFASKDFSSLFLTNVEINNAEYGFVAYEKKAEFGPSNIVVDGVVFSSVDNEYFIEKESKLKLNDIIVLGSEKNVYEKLYG